MVYWNIPLMNLEDGDIYLCSIGKETKAWESSTLLNIQ